MFCYIAFPPSRTTAALVTVQNDSNHLGTSDVFLFSLFKIWHRNYFIKLIQSNTEGRINFLRFCMELTAEGELLICMKEVISMTPWCYG